MQTGDFGFRLESCEVEETMLHRMRSSKTVKGTLSPEKYAKIKKYFNRRELKKAFKVLFTGDDKSAIELKVFKIKTKKLKELKTSFAVGKQDILTLEFSCKSPMDIDESQKEKLKRAVSHISMLLFLRTVIKYGYRMWKGPQ